MDLLETREENTREYLGAWDAVMHTNSVPWRLTKPLGA